MATRRLADRQIRAAAQAALRLDVRGPVSEALGRTGIVVPPASADPPTGPPASTPPTAPEADRAGDRPARKTLGLQSRAPKPITAPSKLPPATARDALTADERRVHRILIESLEREYARQDSGLGSMSYAEKQKLKALDLAHLDAELATMDRTHDLRDRLVKGGLAAGFVALPFVAFFLFRSGAESALSLTAGFLTLLLGLGSTLAVRAGVPQRKAIYEALRELALAADPGETPSAAVAEADRIIDRLAFADLGDAEPSSERAPVPRLRTR
jgi:hypothetical protein